VSDSPQIFGAWEDDPGAGATSHQRMELTAGQLAAHWRRCSLSADFWAAYMAGFVPPEPPPGQLRRDAMLHVIGYLLNELIENCAKFSGGADPAVRYQSWAAPERLVFQITNHIAPGRAAPFAQFIGELLAGDPEELYFQRLEATAAGHAQGSGLGYLTMIKDYGIRFGFRLAQASPGAVAVDVQAHVLREEL
jgi:hypothetical protein